MPWLSTFSPILAVDSTEAPQNDVSSLLVERNRLSELTATALHVQNTGLIAIILSHSDVGESEEGDPLGKRQRSRLHKVVADRVAHQTGGRVKIQLVHDG